MEQIPESRGFMGSVRRWLGGGRRAAVSQIAAQTGEPTAGAAAADRRIEVMLAEWQDIRASLRYQDGVRLVQLAVFVAALATIVAGYLRVAVPDPRLALARWALPALGVLSSLVFLSLELGCAARCRALVRRGRQIETAMQILVPGIGRVRSLALLCDCGPGESRWEQAGTSAAAALYGLMLLAWVAALVAAALGFQ